MAIRIMCWTCLVLAWIGIFAIPGGVQVGLLVVATDARWLIPSGLIVGK